MSVDRGLIAWVEEALAPIGAISWRPMMGVALLYCDGAPFATADGGELWLSSDAESDPAFELAGCERFSFARSDGSVASMRYRRAPGDVYDDPDALRHWAGLAIGAAGRKRSRPPRARKPKGA